MQKIIPFFIFLTAFPLQAQKIEKLDWTQGAVQLSDRSWIEGKIHFDCYSDQLSFMSQNTFKVYEPHELRAFRFLDKNIGIFRHFGSYKDTNKSYFCEQLVTGECHFLVRLRETYVNQIISPSTMASIRRRVIECDYFIWHKNELTKIRANGKVIKELYTRYDINLKEILKEFKLQTFLPPDQAKLVAILNEKLRVLHQPKGIEADANFRQR